MMTDNLFEFLDEIQKLALKAKVQNILDTLVKDERVHEVLNADVVLEYYEKMYEHFEKNPKEFRFPNREWLRESLKRLKVDLSNVFDEYANVDHIKREEVVILFMLLWVNMVIQNPIRIEVIKDPYDLFYIWTKNRVFIARPTETHYLQDGDRRVLDRLGKSYGWFTGVHHFSIGLKGAVEYHYSSPDDITNINGAYNKAHGNVTKLRDMNDWAMSRLTAEQHKLAHADKRHWGDVNKIHHRGMMGNKFTPRKKEARNGVVVHDHRTLYPKSMFRLEVDPEELKKGRIKLGRKDTLSQLIDDVLKEKQRRHNIDRNTKFIVRKMTGMSNKEYKTFLKKFKEKEEMRCYDWLQCFEDIMVISGLELEYEVILEAANQYNLSVYHLNKALLKLKEKINEGR